MYSDNTEMISRLKDGLNGKADETLSRILDSGSCGNLINVFRDCYDEFNRVLIVAKNNKSYSETHGATGTKMIQEVLRQNGILNSKGEVLSAGHIRNLMYRVREERGLTKKRQPAPTPTNPRAAARREIVAASDPAAEEKPAPRPKTTVTPTVRQEPAKPVSAPLSDAAKNFVRPEPVFVDWREAVRTIKTDMGLTPWSGQDEYILDLIFKSYVERRNQYDCKNLWNDYLHFPYKYNIGHEINAERDVIRNLKIKLEQAGVFELFANMGADDYVAP